METVEITEKIELRFASYKELLKSYELDLLKDNCASFEERGEFLTIHVNKNKEFYNSDIESFTEHHYKLVCTRILLGELQILFVRPKILKAVL